MSRSTTWVLAWSAVAVAFAGCGGISTDAIPPETTTTTVSSPPATPTPNTSPHPCADGVETEDEEATETQSYRPLPPNPAPGAMPAGSAMFEIQEREPARLRVGVDETTQGLAYRDPSDGEIKGMEVELAYEIARRIFGDRHPEAILELVPVPTDEKLQVVTDGTVDLTIDAVTVSCDRWQEVAFSTEYLTTDQQFLVRSDSTIRAVADLAGRTVCVTGSSSAEILEEWAAQAQLLRVGPRTDCLVALQQGDVDAYFSHETFLRGMVLQDPTLEVRRDVLCQAADITSHYGIAIAHGKEDLVRFVNQALEEMRVDGTLERLHEVLEQVPCRPIELSTTSGCSDRLGLLPADPPAADYLPPEEP